MNTLACILGSRNREPYLRSSDTPYYRKAWATPPINRDMHRWVIVEETGEVVDHYAPPRRERTCSCKS